MPRVLFAAFLVLCLVLSACKTVVPSPLLELKGQGEEDGTIVFRVAIDKPGWLVLHPASPAGEPETGSVLTRAYLSEAGEYASVNVKMGGAVVGDTGAVAALYYDDPADQNFDYVPGGEQDPPVTVEGEEVALSFTIEGISPYVTVEDTDTRDGAVAIEAGIDGPGWLAVYPATAAGKADTSRLLASTYLPRAGTYPGFDVTVPADTARTYFAVIHYDDPADEEFTFTPAGADDPRVEIDGSAVQDYFTVGQ